MAIMRFMVVIGLALLVGTTSALAEVRCRSDISFQWKKAEGGEKIDVPWGAVVVRGADEAAAKLELQRRVDEEKLKAHETCRKAHENMSGCFSMKFSAMTATLQSLNFSSRKALEEAISADCKSQQGRCEGIASTEFACVTETAAGGSATTETPGGAVKEKEGTKKKK